MVNSTTLAPNVVEDGDRRLQVRASGARPRPARRRAPTARRAGGRSPPSGRAPGRPPVAAPPPPRRATAPASSRSPGVAGPGVPSVNTSSWGSRSHPRVASSATRDAVGRHASRPRGPAQRHGDGVAQDEEAHRAAAVGPRLLQGGVLGRRQAGREQQRERRAAEPAPRGASARATVAAPAGDEGGQPEAGHQAGGAQQGSHTRSRHAHPPPRRRPALPRRAAAPPDRPGRPGRPGPCRPTPQNRPFPGRA